MKRTLLYILLILAAAIPAQARIITVFGRVISESTKEPMQGVTVYNGTTNQPIGVTDSEGKYSVKIDSEDKLVFESVLADPMEEAVNGRQIIDVVMVTKAQHLNEVTVHGKSKGKSVSAEESDIEVEGNMLKFNTRVTIPAKIFTRSRRAVLQPSIYNVSTRRLNYLTPIVYDGEFYDITQRRQDDWDFSVDPISPYQSVKANPYDESNVIQVRDSLRVENPNQDFLLIVASSVETYNEVIFTDTFAIGRGTVNPLRFLSYSLLSQIESDSAYFPTPDLQLRDTEGEMNLLFPVGKSIMDLTLGNNEREIRNLTDEFRLMNEDGNMSLKSFTIYGLASPEGKHASNIALARARMNSAMNEILPSIPAGLKRGAEINSSADVAPWTDVAEAMEADSLFEQAAQIRDIIAVNPGNMDAQFYKIRTLPYYRSIIVEKYLPRLRRVKYRIVASSLRELTDDEIRELYPEKANSMTVYEYFRLYRTEPDSIRREEILRKAIQVHPKTAIFRTDLSSMLLARNDTSAYSLLQPLFQNKAQAYYLSETTKYNMALAALQNYHYDLSDSLLNRIPDTPKTHKARVYSAAMNGRYREVLQEIAEDSPLNEVVILLKLKDNHRAYQKSKALGKTAQEEYVKAIAAYRVAEELYTDMEAEYHLKRAIKLDPSLEELAKVDGDVNQLYDLIKDSLDEIDEDPEENEQQGYY